MSMIDAPLSLYIHHILEAPELIVDHVMYLARSIFSIIYNDVIAHGPSGLLL